MSEAFFDTLASTYNINLSEAQRQAVVHVDGPCLLLAVPGGGKTTTLLSRVAYLVSHEGIPPERLLSITFSRASANDMKERFRDIFGDSIQEKIIFSTIHSFAYRVVMSYMKSSDSMLTLIEGNNDPRHSKGRILRQIYTQINHDYISEGDYELLTGDLSYVKNVMMDTQDIRRFSSEIRQFYEIYQAYEAYKQKHHYMDFDDMLTKCHGILSKEPKVLQHYQRRYDYIQVDEAQDTSRLQHAIIELIAKSHQNIFYVADDDQSIYGFRGATPAYLLNIQAIYKGAVIIRMEQNYRSTKAIVEGVNRFIKKNKKRYDKNIQTNNPQGLPILIHQVERRQDQYPEIVTRLEEMDDYSDVAILYRNNHSAVSMIHSLGKTSVPFKLKGLKRRFFDHWVVTDIMNMLGFVDDTSDLHTFKTFYYKLRGYYISKQMVESIDGHYKQMSVFQQILRSSHLAGYQGEKIQMLEEDFRHLTTLKIYDAIEYLMTQMGYLEFLLDRTGDSSATFDSYNMMIEILKDLAKSSNTFSDLQDAVVALERQVQEAAENTSQNAITLSTVHSAKGLEWSRVFMIDLISGIFPNKDIIDSNDQDAMEEERRLFYVGMTRAKQDLVLFEVNKGMTSPFVEEMSVILQPGKSKKKTKQSDPSKGKERRTPLLFSGFKKTGNINFDPMEPGTAVSHKVYGKGIVKACDHKRITLVFDEGEKKLNYNFCMNQGLIQKLVDG